MRRWWFKHPDQISSGKEIKLQQAQYLLQRTAQLGLEIEERYQQIHAQGNPELSEHRVGRSTQKRLDLQVLLDPFEKLFDLPAFFVNICDLLSLKVMRIGDKLILDTAFQVGVVDLAKALLNSLEPDELILADSRAFSSGPLLQVLDLGIAFQPGDEENSVLSQRVVPAVISKAPVKAGKGTFGQLEGSGPFDLMLFSLGHV